MKLLNTLIALTLALCTALAHAADADPPAVVGRLNYISGPVSFAPAQANEDWSAAELNRPITTGDRLWTDTNGRAEMHVGSLAIRMGAQTSLDVLAPRRSHASAAPRAGQHESARAQASQRQAARDRHAERGGGREAAGKLSHQCRFFRGGDDGRSAWGRTGGSVYRKFELRDPRQPGGGNFRLAAGSVRGIAAR